MTLLRRSGKCGALIVVALLMFGCTAPSGSATPSDAPATRLIYAAMDDGTVHVYDLDAAHRMVRSIRVFACCADVRGAAAAAPTHRFYVMYNRSGQGHVAALDLLTDRLLWDRVLHSPGVDRGDVTPDGRTLYVPTWEGDASAPFELVVDALTGDEKSRIGLPARSHDTIVSLDGQRVFMETKSATGAMYVARTDSNQVVTSIAGYCCSGVLAPFSVNGSGTRVVNDVNGYDGFQVGDAVVGRVVASVPFPAQGGRGGHGIAWTPDEREVWVNDGTAPLVHVFDMTVGPPAQAHLVSVSSPAPHWVTFSISGDFAYLAGRKGAGDPTDVVDTRTYQRVGTLEPSEDLLEVDMAAGAVVKVGSQFGVGRVRG